MRRLPALDGLRAAAVVMVMVFHTSPLLTGGFVGVDVFFVISGFLITALLLAEIDRSGRVDLRAFWTRRALRLLPALVVMIALTVPLMYTVLRDTVDLPPPLVVLGALFYVTNWVDVLGTAAATGPLTHTWSLSIEEQYYLVWPAVLVLALARGKRPLLVRALAAGVVVVVVSRALIWAATQGEWLFYATTSRADGLLLGTLLALVLHRRGGAALLSARGSEALAWISVAALAVLALTLHPEEGAAYYGGLAVATLAATAIVHHIATSETGPMIRLLSLRPVVAVGAVSYGLYLFHFPVFQLVQNRGFSFAVQHGLEFGITAVLTVASYLLVEKPALKLKTRLSSSKVVVLPADRPVGATP